MANKTIKYLDVDWNNVNYTNLSEVKGICKAVKNYFWDNRKNPNRSEIITGEVCSFLITVFETYCPEWSDRIASHEVIGFIVKNAKEQSTQCLHVVLKDCELEDSAFSYSKLSKESRKECDVRDACRTAIQKLKTDFKIRHCDGRCPVSNLKLTFDNAVVHHYNMPMNDIIEKWVKSKGGYDILHQYVNSTIGGGTITCFQDDKIVQEFIEYHNEHTHLVVLHQIGHNMVHHPRHCKTEEQKERIKRYT